MSGRAKIIPGTVLTFITVYRYYNLSINKVLHGLVPYIVHDKVCKVHEWLTSVQKKCSRINYTIGVKKKSVIVSIPVNSNRDR